MSNTINFRLSHTTYQATTNSKSSGSRILEGQRVQDDNIFKNSNLVSAICAWPHHAAQVVAWSQIALTCLAVEPRRRGGSSAAAKAIKRINANTHVNHPILGGWHTMWLPKQTEPNLFKQNNIRGLFKYTKLQRTWKVRTYFTPMH